MSILFKAGAATLLFSLVTACSSKNRGVVVVPGPTITSTVPVNMANGVPLNVGVSATFSEAMDPASINTTTFVLATGNPVVFLTGTVIYSNVTATFWPSARLDPNVTYVATVTTGAQSLNGANLNALTSWSFNTGNQVGPVRVVELASSGNFAVLAKAAISTVPASAVTGDVGLSPAAASFITGFGLTLDGSNQFATSPQVTGRVYAADYAAPTPATLTTAVLDMERAFVDAAARAPDFTELGAGNIGGLTLAPGVYKWSTGLLIPTAVTLNGSGTDVWILQIAQSLDLSSATSVILTGGALPQNVFWQVSGAVELGTTSVMRGNVLTATAIAMRTGASINGRLQAQTAITLDAATVTQPN